MPTESEPGSVTGATGDTVTVTGVGSASAPADLARVHLAATATRPAVADAVEVADAATRRIREALLAAGVAAADAPTAGLTVSAEQVWREGSGSHVTGYTATHAILVTVRELDGLGGLLAAALAAGGDQARLNGVEPAVQDEAGLLARARDAAWGDALARAEQIAALAGRPLGPVRAAEEGGPNRGGGPRQMAVALRASEAADLDVEAGDVSVEVELRVRWELA